MITPIVKNEGCTVIFGPCRLSYTYLFTKYSPKSDPKSDPDNGKYTTNVLIPKKEKQTVKALRDAIEAAKRTGMVSKWGGKELKKLDLPLHDGDVDKEDDKVYAGNYFVNAKTTKRPGVIGRDKAPIVDEEDVYSGMWAIVSVTFFPYDVNGNRGVAVGLNNVMKYKDDTRLGGRSSAESDFAEIDMGDDESDFAEIDMGDDEDL